MSSGQVILGAWVSLTVTVKLQMLVLPELSVAVLTTVVEPLAKVDPLAGTLTTLTPGQLSLALTVTVKLQMLVLPELSVAVLTTVVEPLAKVDPLAGTLTTLTPGQLSLALTVKLTT